MHLSTINSGETPLMRHNHPIKTQSGETIHLVKKGEEFFANLHFAGQCIRSNVKITAPPNIRVSDAVEMLAVKTFTLNEWDVKLSPDKSELIIAEMRGAGGAPPIVPAKLAGLQRALTELTMRIPSDDHRFQGVVEVTPLVVVVGDQSSGKSTLMNRLAGGHVDFPVGVGQTTGCPILLTLKADATQSKFSWHANGQLVHEEMVDGDRINITEIHRQVTQGQIVDGFMEVVVPTRSEFCMTFVDLPGVTAEALANRDHIIFRQINERIGRPEALILLVVDASADPGRQLSVQEISPQTTPELVSRSIMVFTKMDRAIQDVSNAETIALIIQKAVEGHLGVVGGCRTGVLTAPVLDVTEEVGVIEEAVKVIQQQGTIIPPMPQGCANLQRLVFEEMASRIQSCLPQIEVQVRNAKSVVHDELQRILREPPLPREVKRSYTRNLHDRIRTAIKAGGQPARIELNRLRDEAVSAATLEKLGARKFPNNGVGQGAQEELARQLKKNTGDEIPGTGGCWQVVKPLLQSAVDGCHAQVENYIREAHKAIIQGVQGAISEAAEHPMATAASSFASSEIESYLGALLEEDMKAINKELKTLRNVVYNDKVPKLVDKMMFRTMIGELFKGCDQLTHNQALFQSDQIADRHGVDVHAEVARQVILAAWKEMSGELHNKLARFVGEMEEKYIQAAQEHIQEIPIDHFKEPDKIGDDRRYLLDLERAINHVIEQIDACRD